PESIQRLFKDGLVKPSLLGAQITPSQEVALMKGLSVYAKNRYQDCTSFLEALNKDKFGYGGVARSYEYVYNVNREIFGTEKSGRAESEYKGVDGKTVRYDWDSGVDGVEEQILPKSSAFNRTDSNRLADSALAFANWQNRSGNAWQKPPQPTPNIPKTDWRQTGWRGDSQWQPNRQDWNPGQYGRGAGGYDNQNQSPQNTQWGDSQNLGRTKTQNPMLTRLLKKKR
ncbi:MAG: hypothetical protein FWD76_02290, partial [Firmicutes bacterium]|nr:hypothetical protein [Bacillota bacterium]